MLVTNFKCKPSKICTGLFLSIASLTVGIICSLTIAYFEKFILIVMMVIYCSYIFWRFILLRSRFSIIRLQLLSNYDWNLHTPEENYIGKLCGDSVVTIAMCILRFRLNPNGRKISCVLFPDSLLDIKYRRLLVSLHAMSHEVFESNQNKIL